MEEVQGYGDPECRDCQIVKNNPAMALLCQAMVEATKHQIAAGHRKDWKSAINWEKFQNNIVTSVLFCDPGRDRL